MLFLCLFQLVHIDWFAILYDHVCAVDPWKMIFKGIIRIVHGYRYHRTVGFVCQLEARLMKLQQLLSMVSGSLRCNKYGMTGF